MPVLVVIISAVLAPATAAVPVVPLGIERLPNGNTLIADEGYDSQMEARVLEVDSLGRLVWAYIGSDVPLLHTARRLANGNTLMTASGGNRVVEVDPDGDTVWTMNEALGLSYPNDAYRLANGNTLITDRNNNRVVEVTPGRQIAWNYSGLNAPHNGSRLANGNTLICDSENDRVIEVDALGTTVRQYASNLDWPRSAERLANGNTLIADSRHNRVLEVDGAGTTVWNAGGLALPFAAHRLDNGNTLVAADTRVVELTPAGSIVWQYPNTVPVVVETLRVVNPSSGCSLYVHIHRPAYAGPGHRVPAVVFAPDRCESGSSLDPAGLPDDIASDGFAFLHFDPDGRGRSSACPEDYDGYVHQDGMHACLSLLAGRPYVDTSRLGVFSQGYGITMASGMIARHSQPRVRFLLDSEGPADRTETCLDSGGFVPVPADSEAFWQEREAIRFISLARTAYLRLQAETDSSPGSGDNQHLIGMVNAATATAYGGRGVSTWTRVNDSSMNPANRVYVLQDPPVWIPKAQKRQDLPRVLLYLHEMAGKDLSGVAERRLADAAPSLRVFPRPCRGMLQVGLPPSLGERELRVRDICGRLVAQAVVPSGSQRTTLDLCQLRPGVYYVSVAGAGAVPVVVVR